MKLRRSTAGALLLPALSAATVLERQTFKAPFLSHDHRGNRVIPHWDHGGAAIVKQSFLRLTPDKPHQRGFLWTRAPMIVDEFSLTFKFRISGGDERMFGEALALFITTEARPIEGPLYGFRDQFVGFGVIVDTWRDSTVPSKHRDVSVVVNDGTKNLESVNAALTGCNANVRYFEKRDDFNVLKASRIRLKYKDKMLTVEIDARNTGRWRRCASTPIELPENWLQQARVGIMATTGQTSDNHDVLALTVYDDANEAFASESEEGAEWTEGGAAAGSGEDDFLILVHHMEHELYGVHDALQATIEKLEQQEEESERRIAELEGQIRNQVYGLLNERVASLEERVRGNVASTLNGRLASLEDRMEDKIVDSLTRGVGQAARSWRLPFVALLLLLALVVGAAVKQYRYLRKQHLL